MRFIAAYSVDKARSVPARPSPADVAGGMPRLVTGARDNLTAG